MAVPFYSRTIPIALAANEVILTVPRRPSRNGDGFSALRARIIAGATTTVVTFSAALTEFSDFEAGAFATADRFNGLRIRVGSIERFITDYDGAGALTIAPALPVAPGVDTPIQIGADIPLHVARLIIIPTSDTVKYNTEDQAGLIAIGQFTPIYSGESHMIIDNDFGGVAGFPIRIASGGAGATSINMQVMIP